jgi:hypothetical protein
MTNTTTTAHPARAFAIAIDSQAGDVDGECLALEAQVAETLNRAHREAGDRQVRGSYRGAPLHWELDDASALDVCEDNTRAQLAALQTAIGENRDRAAALQQVWRTHGQWSRFFKVTSSDGHVHSTTSCSQRGATTYAWCPELSGLTEANAVAAYGPILCTKCFPDAPAEWTWGALPEGACTGSRKAPKDRPRRVGRHYVGECSVCGGNEYVNGDGRVRLHDRPLTADEAAAKEAARKAQAKVAKAENDLRYWARIVERTPESIARSEGYLATAVERGDGDSGYAASLRAEIERARRELETATRKAAQAQGRLDKARAALAA